MNLAKLAVGAALYTAGCYLWDVPIRRSLAAGRARAYADLRGKPLLNVGAGTNGVELFTSWPLYPATLYGDVNVDWSGARDVPHGTPGVVTFADAHSMPEFPSGGFGAVLASHVLEHLADPRRALAEWLRLVGGDLNALFVVTPSWWTPHAYWAPSHYWWFADGQGCTTGCTPRVLRPQALARLLQEGR